MTALVVAKVGPVTSVQDYGRKEWQRYGVSPSGAMDKYSLSVANALVGQELDAAAIEIGPFPAEFVVIDGSLQIAVTGASRLVKVGGKSVPMNTTLDVASNQIVEIGRCLDGVFSYLALGGGILAGDVMGSKSTHVKSQLGSPYRRHLDPGDVIRTRASTRPLRRMNDPPPARERRIRVVLGPQTEYFSRSEIEKFLDTRWKVSAASDRTCYRLDGPPVQFRGNQTMVTDGTSNGSIQISGAGQPLILLADRGPMGGYPKIAAVITADLGRLAQVQAGRSVQFSSVGIEAAQEEARRFYKRIRDIPARLELVDCDTERLLQMENVAGSAVNAFDELL